MKALAVFLIVACALLAAVGQVLLRKGMLEVASIDGGGTLTMALRAFLQPYVIAGLALYVVCAFLYLMLLSEAKVVVAYSVVALSLVITALLGWLTLGEPVPALRLAGLGLIIVGVSLVVMEVG